MTDAPIMKSFLAFRQPAFRRQECKSIRQTIFSSQRLLALISSLLLVMTFMNPAIAQPRCVFLECGPSNAPNPAPAQVPKLETSTPLPKAGPQHQSRYKRANERCHHVRSYSYCASSVLSPQYGNTYGPDRLVDEDLRTAWVEGRRGHGIGEYLAVDLGGAQRVIGIQVMNGYHKNARLFRANSRVRSAIVRFSNGTRRKIKLKDAPGIQTIEFPAINAIWLEFELREVYPGTKYKDTAITELRILTAQ